MAVEPLHIGHNRASRLNNETCVYCADPLTPESATIEHVVGRRFVPKGTLDKHWNLIVRACARCNEVKARLEDDISAITMHPDSFGHCGSDESRIDYRRKASGSRSSRTGKPVSESAEGVTIKGSLGLGLSITMNLDAPPQIDDYRAFELARMQLTAFFYFISYDPMTRRGGFWRGGFFPKLEAVRSDWGNAVHRSFMSMVHGWEPRLIASTASHHFAVAIRRHPSAPCWSWALEWNRSLRLVGFFGDRAASEQISLSLPPLEMHTVHKSTDSIFRLRADVPLNENEDNMFSVPEDES